MYIIDRTNKIKASYLYTVRGTRYYVHVHVHMYLYEVSRTVSSILQQHLPGGCVSAGSRQYKVQVCTMYMYICTCTTTNFFIMCRRRERRRKRTKPRGTRTRGTRGTRQARALSSIRDAASALLHRTAGCVRRHSTNNYCEGYPTYLPILPRVLD